MPRMLLSALTSLVCAGAMASGALAQVQGTRRTATKSRQTWAEVVERDRAQPARPPRPLELGPRMPSPNRALHPAQPTVSMLPWAISPFDRPSPPPRPGPAADNCVPFIGDLLEPTRQFEALDDNLTAIPPDTTGAVGLRHAMTMLNTEVGIKDRAGLVEYSTVGIGAFWPTLAGPFDPKMYHDNHALRWVTVALGSQQAAGSNLAIQVSDTSDPTGAWSTITLDADGPNTRWLDYPCVGFNNRWIVVCGTMFGVPGVPNPGALGTKMWVLDKAEFYGPGQSVTVWEFEVGFAPNASVMQPAVVQDPLESDLLIVENTQQTSMQNARNLFRLSRLVGGADPVWEALPGSTYTVAGYFEAPARFSNGLRNGPQKNSPFSIEIGDSRACNAVVRNGRLWFTHTGGVILAGFERPETAVYWYELTPALPNPVVQSGWVGFGQNFHLSHPSIAVNCSNDVCIGYSYTSPNDFVSASHSNRRGEDPPGAMFTNPAPLVAGGNTYVRLASGRNRWGDYSATVVDPLDHMSFWTIQESASATLNQWTTTWFQFAHDCSGAPTITQQPAPPAVACPGSSFSLSVQAAGGGGSHTYQWIKDGDPIAGATSQIYTKQGATPADTGVYSVNVYGLCGAAQSQEVQVSVGAEILTHPQNASVAPCTTVAFTVAARGVGPLSYQWYRMGPLGVPIPLADTPRRTGTRSPAMVITGVRYEEDEHDYLCQVFDSCPTYAPFTNVASLRIDPGTPPWTQRSGDGPRIRAWTEMAYDAARGVCVLYGGGTGALMTQTWEWDGLEWTQKFPAHNPGPRYQHEMVFDSSRGRVLLFGGQGASPNPTNDVWAYDGTDWTLVAAATPSGPRGEYWVHGDAAFDASRDRVLVLLQGPNIPGQTTNDTWEFEPATGVWTKTHSGGGPDFDTSPIGVDPLRGVISTVSQPLNNWRYTSPAWGAIPTGLGLDRYYPIMAYDTLRQRLTAYGCCRNLSSGHRTDTYAFDGTFWLPIIPEFHSGPTDTLIAAAMAYDTRRRAMVLVGYKPSQGLLQPFQTWEYRYTDGVAIDRQPADQPLSVGQSATFRVRAAGQGALAYQWRRDGTALAAGTTPHGSVIGGVGTDTLTIANLASQDAGLYDCVVSNACGSLTSAGARLGQECIPDVTASAVPGSPGYGVPNGTVNNDDFFYYLAQFAAGNVAVCDLTTSAVAGQPGYGVPNGVINNDDFFFYLAHFAAGCP